MKASEHLALGLAVLIGLIIASVLTGNTIWNAIVNALNLDLLTILVGAALYLIGLILPDSDSKDAGSRIFHTKYFIFGWITKLLEYPLSLLLKRKIGHRESLHTIFGIIFSSFVLTAIISIPFLIGKNFHLFTAPYLFFCLFFGQIMHLVGDWYWKIR